MSSKIKVDTIENVAGSGNVSLGSGHNLVVPGNITGQGTAAITGNTTVGGTLGVTGATTLANGGSAVPLSIATHVSTHELAFTGSTHANIAANNGANPFYIQSIGAGSINLQTTSTDRMIIDASGNITKPHQPRFCAYIGGNNLAFTSLADNQVVDFNAVNVNTGNHFSTSTHLFTAPVAGTYWFGTTMRIDNIGSSGSDYWHGYLGKNGSTTLEGSLNGRMISSSTPHNIFNMASGSWIVQLAANDTIGIYHGDGNSAGVHAGSAYYQSGQCNFSGYLLA